MVKQHPIRPHLRAWRVHFGRSQDWLANELGTSHTTVGRWENGTAGVDDATFAEIARIYGITISELMAAPAEAAKARQVARLMEALRRLDEEGVAAVALMAERLAPK